MCGSISAHSSSVVSLAYRSPSRRYLMRVISVHDILGSPSLLTPRQNHKWLESLNSIFGQPLRESVVFWVCDGTSNDDALPALGKLPGFNSRILATDLGQGFAN